MSILYSLAAAVVALIALVVVLRFFDILAGQKFKPHVLRYKGGQGAQSMPGVLGIINSDARAAALYYGLRFLGASILIGLVVSAVRFTL